MNRKTFLKLSGAMAVLAILPKIGAEETPKTEPKRYVEEFDDIEYENPNPNKLIMKLKRDDTIYRTVIFLYDENRKGTAFLDNRKLKNCYIRRNWSTKVVKQIERIDFGDMELDLPMPKIQLVYSYE